MTLVYTTKGLSRWTTNEDSRSDGVQIRFDNAQTLKNSFSALVSELVRRVYIRVPTRRATICGRKLPLLARGTPSPRANIAHTP
jgi:hypothetical protein